MRAKKVLGWVKNLEPIELATWLLFGFFIGLIALIGIMFLSIIIIIGVWTLGLKLVIIIAGLTVAGVIVGLVFGGDNLTYDQLRDAEEYMHG